MHRRFERGAAVAFISRVYCGVGGTPDPGVSRDRARTFRAA